MISVKSIAFSGVAPQEQCEQLHAVVANDLGNLPGLLLFPHWEYHLTFLSSTHRNYWNMTPRQYQSLVEDLRSIELSELIKWDIESVVLDHYVVSKRGVVLLGCTPMDRERLAYAIHNLCEEINLLKGYRRWHKIMPDFQTISSAHLSVGSFESGARKEIRTGYRKLSKLSPNCQFEIEKLETTIQIPGSVEVVQYRDLGKKVVIKPNGSCGT